MVTYGSHAMCFSRMEINVLRDAIMRLARKKGWGTKPKEVHFAEKIALIHSEASEALEAYRKHNITGRDSVTEELTDILMRVVHLAGIYNIDLEKEVMKKMKRNATRDWSNDRLYVDKRKKSIPR